MSTYSVKKVTNGYVVTVYPTNHYTGGITAQFSGYAHPAEHIFKTKKEMFDWLENTI